MADDQAPQITEVRYDPGALTLGWAPMTASGLTGFRILLRQDGGDPQHWDVGATTYFHTVDQTLDPQSTYTAAVATLIDGAPGDQSDWLPVILLAPQMMSVVYDIAPELGLGLRWAAVEDDSVTGYTAVLIEEGGPTNTRSTGDTAAFFEGTLHVNRSYTTSVRATAQYGIVMGPASTEYRPVLVTPQVSGLIYDIEPASVLTMRWGATGDPAVSGYAATLREAGAGHVDTVNTDALFARFEDVLDAAERYDATVRATSNDGIVQGPPSPALNPIVLQPAVSALVYDLSPDAVLTMRWGPVGDDQVDGYLAVLSVAGGSPETRTPSDTEAVFEGALDESKTYQAQVRATANNGVIEGPASQALAPILTTVALDLVDYDGAGTTYTWQAAQDPAIVKYLAVLSTTGSSPQNRLTDAVTARFEGVLPVAATSAAYLRGTNEDGVVQGPDDSIAALVTAAPSLTELDYDIGALTPSWTAVEQTPVSGYRVEISDGGTPQQVDTGDVTQTTIDLTLSPARTWSVSVRPTGQRLLGPPSGPLQPIVAQPARPALYYDGEAFPFYWGAVADPNVEGYQAELYQNGSLAGDKAVTEAEVTFARSIEAGLVYTARVRPTGDRLKGPWTEQAPGPFKMTQTYGRDAYGRIETVQIDTDDRLTYTIDAAGNVTDRSVGTGSS